MNEYSKKAAFSFEGYRVMEFFFRDSSEDDQNSLTINFIPRGEYYSEESKYLLYFDFLANTSNSQEEIIKITIQAVFKFSEPTSFEDIPSYFYRNIIAIVFPYLRSFVTTITCVGNIKPLILPILNLTNLEQPLKESTVQKN